MKCRTESVVILMIKAGRCLYPGWRKNKPAWKKNTFQQNKIGKNEFKKVKLIKNYINANDHKKAARIFETLPDVIKKQKLHKLIYIQIANGLGDEKYLAALNKLRLLSYT